MFTIIDNNLANEIVSFISHRPGIPKDVEDTIVERQKKYYIDKLVGKNIKTNKIDDLKKNIKLNFYKSLIQPGETVGIICGQCIGEKTTQSSLNNFHSAGLDTGATSQIDSLQNIINASKMKKKELRKYFKVSLFLKNKPNSLNELKKETIQYLEEIKLKDLIESESFIREADYTVPSAPRGVIHLHLSLEKIFLYRIKRQQILDQIPCKDKHMPAYSTLSEESEYVTLTCYYDTNINKFDLIRQIREAHIIGIEGVNSHMFVHNNEEWYIDCLCNTINVFFKYSNIYDLNRIICNSIYDMYTNFGILVAHELIIQKCKTIIPGIDESHFKILAMRMTKNGVIEPLTRYTMRNNNSPLSKASFEESFETFIKACKYNEKEKFKSVSSSIICGKKPNIGTYQADILIDPLFFLNN